MALFHSEGREVLVEKVSVSSIKSGDVQKFGNFNAVEVKSPATVSGKATLTGQLAFSVTGCNPAHVPNLIPNSCNGAGSVNAAGTASIGLKQSLLRVGDTGKCHGVCMTQQGTAQVPVMQTCGIEISRSGQDANGGREVSTAGPIASVTSGHSQGQAPNQRPPASELSNTDSAAKRPASQQCVADWPMRDKLVEAARRAALRLPADVRSEFQSLFSAQNLAITGTVLVAWATSQAIGAGEVVDAILILAGAVFLGRQVIQVAQDFIQYLRLAANAKSDADLDLAACHLAKFVAVVGVATFVSLIVKVGVKFRGRLAGTTQGKLSGTTGSSALSLCVVGGLRL